MTAAEYNEATDNGQNLNITKYVSRDADGNITTVYNESEVSSITGWDVIRSTGTSTTYSLEQNTHYYVPSSLDEYDFSANLDIKFSSKKQFIVTTYTYDYTLTGTTTYPISDEISLSDESGSGSATANADARNSAKSSAKTSLGRYAYRATFESVTTDTGKTAILDTDILTALENEEWVGSVDQAYDYTSKVYAFDELEAVTYEYGVRESTADREILFDAVISVAPTGTFAVDYAVIDDTTTLSIANEYAAFEIKDANGNVLTQGVDYTYSTNPCSIKVLTYSIGCMEYIYSGLAAGTYTVTQTEALEGYAIDDTEYTFTVDRRTGEVIGDSFSKSGWNGSYTALTNNKWSILGLYSFNIFKNSSFSFTFSNHDQYANPVYEKTTPSGSTFIMIDRAAAVEMVEILANNGITSLGNLDLTGLITDITNLDFSSLDVNMIVQLIALIAQYAPELFSEIKIPAILTATTASDGTVTFESSSNVLNTVGAVLGLTGNVVDAETLATILESVLGTIVSEDILNLLVTVLNTVDISNITISTRLPESTYLLYESAVPGGYSLGQNLIGDTIYVSSNGTAYAYKGAIVRGAAELIEQYLNIDLSQIFITSDAFNELLSDTYESYEQYIIEAVGTLADVVVSIFEQMGVQFTEEQLAAVDELVLNVARDFVNGTIDSNDVLNQIVDGVSNIISYNEDWFNPTVVDEAYVIQNDIYESLLNVAVTDCAGNVIDGAEYTVTDADGNTVEIAQGGTTVIYNTYKLNVTSVPSGYSLNDAESVQEIFAKDDNGNYTLTSVYHKELATDEKAPTRGETGTAAGVVCECCNTVLSGCEEIAAIGVNVTVDGSSLGTAALNGNTVSNETVNLAYKTTYTLTAEPSEGCEFIGWQTDGKIVSKDTSYTTSAYADVTYTPLFAKLELPEYTITFVDSFNNVIATLTSSEVAELTSMPKTPEFLGLVFSGWSMTLDEIKALSGDAVVSAYYEIDKTQTYTITADNCLITVDGEAMENEAAGVTYNSYVTVTPLTDTATSWSINGAVVGYGESYSFYCGADSTVTYEAVAVVAKPTVSAISYKISSAHKVKFIASRSVTDGFTLIESGFVYGKAMAEDDLILENVGTAQGSANAVVKKITNSSKTKEGQFALTYGVTAKNANACACAYLIYADNTTGETSVIYSDAMIYEY